MRRFCCVMVLLFMGFPMVLQAQYLEEWWVYQNFDERGILYFDYNHDGNLELTKIVHDTVRVYEGADNYSIFWTVTDPQYEFLTIWELYHFLPNEENAVFIASNSTDEQNFRIHSYEIQADDPVYSTEQYPGTISFLTADSLDDDPPMELLFGYNIYLTDDENYQSKFVILNGVTGVEEYQSPLFNGYMVGPYAGDIDGDGTVEILFNLYDYAAVTSTLNVYSFTPPGVNDEGPVLPSDIKLGENYPNPFNSRTVIPVQLQKPASVDVRVYNIQGQEVKRLIHGSLPAGSHFFPWDGRTGNGIPVASGMYFYEVTVDGHPVRKPMVLSK